MITIERVCGTDLFSYESLDISLDDRGLVIVEGANGSGKTSIFDTLLWTLFGRSTKKILADDVIREDSQHQPIKGKTRGYVCLKNGDTKVEVFRHRAHKEYSNKLLVYVDGVEQTLGVNEETQAMLDGYIGMDYDTFISAVVFPQDGKGFIGLSDSQQKAILDRIVDTERFTRAREYNKIILDKNRDTLARCAATIYELQAALQTASDDEKRIGTQQDEWMVQIATELRQCNLELKHLYDTPPQSDPDLDQRIEEALEYLSQDRFLAIQKRAREISQDLLDLKTKIVSYESEKKFLITRVGPRPAKALTPSEEARKTPPEAMAELIRLLQGNILRAEAEIQVRESDLVSVDRSMENYSGTCPLCGSKADPVAEAKLLGDSRQTKLDIEQSLIGLKNNIQLWKNELEKNLNFQKEITQWVAYLSAIESYKQIDELDDSIASLQLAVSDAEEERTGVDEEYKSLLNLRQDYDKLCAVRETQQKAITEHSHQIAQSAARLKEVQSRVCPFIGQLESLRARNKAARYRIARLEDLQQTVARLVEAGTAWDYGFGNKGLKSLILSHVFPTLTEKTNTYLVYLSDGAHVSFSSQTVLGTGEVREKIETTVLMENGGGSYNKASGGEQQKVDLSSLFALGDLAAERSQTRINLRLLDEPFDSLDKDGAERVVRVLEELVVPTSKTVLVMSHSDHIKSLVPNRIEVSKVNGISRLQTS